MADGRVLVVDQDGSTADRFRVILEGTGCTVRTVESGSRTLAEVERADWDLVFLDLVLPDVDGLELLGKLKARRPGLVVVAATPSDIVGKGLAACQAGAYAFLEKPHDITPEKILTVAANALERKGLVARITGRTAYADLVGRSEAMQKVFELLDRVASVDASVLIVGEPGTEKALVARTLHYASPRADGPFVTISCVALPRNLMESELFGYAKGALGGATADKPGLVEKAHRGSLLLDDIDGMPTDLQVKLDRVLGERKLRRRGRARAVDVDVRLIGSTSREPEGAVYERRRRRDVYGRVGAVIRIPPLRERAEDVGELVRQLLTRFAERHGKRVDGIGADAYRALLGYAWPGNVRELENAIERAVLVAGEAEITVSDLPEVVTRARQTLGASALNLARQERQAILQALEATSWNKLHAARLLGLHRPTLYSKMRKHDIPQRRSV
jgi:DNA-binding NtrC family response regulator